MQQNFPKSISNTIQESICKTGQPSNNIKTLSEILKNKHIIVNDLFQIFPDKHQKPEVFEILIDFYTNTSLTYDEKLSILRELVKLKIKKSEICIIIINEIKKIACNSDNHNCWEFCNLLYELKQSKFSSDYICIAGCKKLKSNRQMVFLLMGKLNDDCYIPTIIENLNDESVNGHALSALSKYSDRNLNKFFIPFLNDNRTWVKKIAEKRLDTLSNHMSEEKNQGTVL